MDWWHGLILILHFILITRLRLEMAWIDDWAHFVLSMSHRRGICAFYESQGLLEANGWVPCGSGIRESKSEWPWPAVPLSNWLECHPLGEEDLFRGYEPGFHEPNCCFYSGSCEPSLDWKNNLTRGPLVIFNERQRVQVADWLIKEGPSCRIKWEMKSAEFESLSLNWAGLGASELWRQLYTAFMNQASLGDIKV